MIRPFFFMLTIFAIAACNVDKDTSTPADFELELNPEKSILFLKEELEENKSNPENYIRLSISLIDNNQFQEANKILKEGHDRFPLNQEIQLYLVQSLIKNGNMESASELFDKLAVENENLLYYHVASEYWLVKGEYAKSLDNINRAINLDNGNSDYYAIKARDLLSINDTINALNNFQLSINKENVSLSTYLGYLKVLILVNDERAFQEILSDFSPVVWNKPEVKLVLVNYLVNKQEYDSAKTFLFSISHQDFELQKIKLLSDINYQQRNYDSALFYLNDFSLISSDLLFIRARAYDKLGNYPESEEAYENILEIDSTNTIALEELEKLRRKVRYLRDIKRREENTIKIVPRNPITPLN